MNYNPCVSTNRIAPDSWCKKSESKGAVVPPADFLLEKDLRGSPPKSEKAAAFWRVGGAGLEVQPFLRKDSSDKDSIDLKADLSIESHKKIDSKFALDSYDLDSSLHGSRRFAQNDDRVDCHNSTTNLTQSFRHTERSEVSKSSESNQMQNAMTQERMGESHRFAQSKKIVGDSQVAKIDCHESLRVSRNDNIFLDSSLRSSRRFAQNDEFMDYHE